MNRIYIICFSLLILSIDVKAQIDSTFVDESYLEDQIYFSLTYNILINKPDAFEQYGISGGVNAGFIKDIPINKQRNMGFGIGLGYAYNAYNQNLKITNENVFTIIPNDQFNSNRLIINTVEVPLEFRWRTSTPTKYSFWRIYMGLKFGYIFSSSSSYNDSLEDFKIKSVDGLRRTQYGVTLSAGYSTFNLHLYYGLTPLFEDNIVTDTGANVSQSQLNIGLIFYIL